VRSSILVVDDELHIRNLLHFLLEDEGFQVRCVGSGEDALTSVEEHMPSLVILDINLPGIDGYEVCRELRKHRVPVLFLSSRDEEHDVIYGLEVGGMDYIRKPFNHRELILRARNLIGREPTPADTPRGYACGALEVRLDKQKVSLQGQVVRLSPNEFDLLALLMGRRGAVVSNLEILKSIWGHEEWDGGRELVKVNVRRLRKKIEPNPHEPLYIINQWGRGYRFKGTVTEL